MNRARALPSRGAERSEGTQSADPGGGRCRTLFAVHMAPESSPCSGLSAPGGAQAAASPSIARRLHPPGLPQVLMGGRPGLPGVLPVLVGSHKSPALQRALPDPQAPCCRFLPALNTKFYSFSERTGRVSIFCAGGAKVSNKQMCPRSSSLISPALCAAQTGNTYTRPVQL